MLGTLRGGVQRMDVRKSEQKKGRNYAGSCESVPSFTPGNVPDVHEVHVGRDTMKKWPSRRGSAVFSFHLAASGKFLLL
jgi:hypothetical protein